MVNKIKCVEIPYDKNSSYQQGSAAGPAAIKGAFYDDATNTYSEHVLDISEQIEFVEIKPIVDFEADIIGQLQLNIEPSQKFVCLGGDHSITFPILKSIAQYHCNLHVIVLDAHPDLYADFEGNYYSHASPFARIMEQKLVAKLTQIGIRTANKHQSEQAEAFKVHTIPMSLFDEHLELSIDAPVYLSIDLDVLDPAFASGVSHPEPGGMSTRQLINFLQNNKHLNLVGADIVECNPSQDINGLTARVGAKILKELVALMVK